MMRLSNLFAEEISNKLISISLSYTKSGPAVVDCVGDDGVGVVIDGAVQMLSMLIVRFGFVAVNPLKHEQL